MTEQLIPVVIEAAIRSTLLALLVAVLLHVLRVPRGAPRHTAWLIVLIAMLLMPVLQRLSPPLPLSPQVPDVAQFIPLPSTNPPPALSRTPADAPDSAVVRGISAPVNPAASLRIRWPAIAAGAYSMIAGTLLLRLILALYGVRMIVRRARPLGDGTFESADIATPVTVGVLRPRVMLPVSWKEWPADTHRAVLLHERAHARRRDPLVALLARLNRCVFWFHPLSWWLERTLLDSAEDACDQAALRTITEPRRYAEVLLAMAEASRQAGGRLAWTGTHVHGGTLSRRIDRILHGTGHSTRTSQWIATAGCALLVVLVACQSRPEVQPLSAPDLPPFVVEQRREGERYEAIRNAAHAMTWEEATALQSQWQQNPEDFAAAEKLLFFYEPDVSGKRSPDDPKKIAGRRPVILWLIEHHPDSDLIRRIPGRIFPPGDWLPDPQGYASAKKLWLAHAARPDVTAKTLGTAAAYLDVADKPLAEQLLLQGQRKYPGPVWSRALGRLYAETIVGSNRFTLFNVVHSTNAEQARGKYASRVRTILDTSSDPVILAAAGSFLSRNVSQATLEFDRIALARTYLHRAIQLDPKSEQARYARDTLDSLDVSDQLTKERQLLAGVSREMLPEAIAKLPEDVRLGTLARQAAHEYMSAESDDWRTRHPQVPGDDHPDQIERNRQEAKAAWQRSKSYAQAALDLARRLPNHPDHGDALFSAKITLGANAFREGNRNSAVRYMLAAADAPPSPTTRMVSPILILSLELKLIPQLLKYGERETVIEYFERSADKRPADRERLLAAASAIENGKQPITTYVRGWQP